MYMVVMMLIKVFSLISISLILLSKIEKLIIHGSNLIIPAKINPSDSKTILLSILMIKSFSSEDKKILHKVAIQLMCIPLPRINGLI